jgi:predicted nucleic acid-binding protein
VSKRRLIDTKLIVRYLVQDHEKHGKTAEKLFDACDRGELILVVLPAVLAECVFVLDSFYGRPRRHLRSGLPKVPRRPRRKPLVNLPGALPAPES